MWIQKGRRSFSFLSLLCVELLALSLFQPCVFVYGSDAQEQRVVQNADKALEDGDKFESDDKQTSDETAKSTANGSGRDVPNSKQNGTFDRLYAEGIKAYNERLWYSCAFKIESALKDYSIYSNALTTCRLECNEGIRVTKLSNVSSNVEEFSKFFTFLKIADCFRRCKEEMVGERKQVSVEMELAFQERSPYLYLQFCYYKLDKYKLAASSSYTYYLSHPDDADTKENIRYYRDSLKVPESDFRDLEITPFKENYIKGILAYVAHDWLSVIKHMEQSVLEFLKEIPKCQANCYGTITLTDGEFITKFADGMTRIMMCQIECETKLSVVYSDPIPHILQDIFHHLQYAYYSVQDYDKCIEAVASFLHMNESHGVMRTNRESMKKLLRYTDKDFIPRMDIQQYVSQRKDMVDSFDLINRNYRWPGGVEADEGMEYEEIVEELKTEPVDWMANYERLGMNIVAKATDLHRKERFVSDGIFKPEQCDHLRSLMNEVSYGSGNVKFFNFRTAQQILKKNPDDANEASVRLLVRAAEVVRAYVQKYTQSKVMMFLKHSSIICYKPSEEKLDCLPQEDGSCLTFEEMPDELSTGFFTSVTYLNDADEDGDFYFLSGEKEKDGSFGVKCGRTVGFNTEDRHSLNIPHSRERCAFVIRYSTERGDNDKELINTVISLKKIEEFRRAKSSISTEEVMKSFKEKGVKITKRGKELKGKERFLADGLANEHQCNTMKSLVLKFGLEGDGYEGKKSPHTESEIFAGLHLTQLIQSVALAGDGYEHMDKKPSKISPHTENEIFVGINVYRASKLYHAKEISLYAYKTFLELSENSRLLVEKYFNLTSPLYFDFTHLVCRKARDDSRLNRKDLSHPVHADNCVLKPDGSCSKEFPAFSQRDYSAILYMNDDFQGGEFFFAHRNRTEQISIRPKCGRIVGFSAGELHGVRAVLTGERCALALWFTQDPNFRELSHIHGRKLLKDMEKEEEPSSSTAVHEEF